MYQAAAAAAEKKEQHAKSKQNSSEDGETHPPPSEDIQADKLASTTDPLQQAVKFLIPLQSFASSRIETHLLAYEIYSRKGVYYDYCMKSFSHPMIWKQPIRIWY